MSSLNFLRVSNSFHNFKSDPSTLILILGILAGVVRGYQKAVDSRPEWNYWEHLATSSWQDVVGADQPVFGYLPGFAALVKPFFVFEQPIGLLLFLVVNAACSVGILIILRDRFWNDGDRLHPALALMTAITVFLGLQNNQVVAPSLLLTLIAFFAIMRNQKVGVIALSLAVLVKTLPATCFLLFALIRRFWLAVLAGLVLAVLSFTLSTLTDGMTVSFEAHLGFLEQVSAQDPNRILTEGVAPSSLNDNASLKSVIVQLAPHIGSTAAYVLNLVIFLGTLVIVCYLSYTASRRLNNLNSILALWLCWTILAAPFGRYYYLGFLLPAWWLLLPKATPEGHSVRALAGLVFVALLPLASRSTEVFVGLVVLTFFLCVRQVRFELREALSRQVSTPTRAEVAN